jgi:hypothetical protein
MIDPLSVLVTSVGSAAGKAAAKETADILRDLVGVQRAEVRVLSRIEAQLDVIDRKVTILVDASFTTGRRQFEDAVLMWDREAERERLLQDARAAFVSALSHETDPLRRSVVAFYLSVVWLAFGSQPHVLKYLEEAHLDALRALANDQSTPVAAWANDLARGRRAGGVQPREAPLFLGLLPCRDDDRLMTLAVLEREVPDIPRTWAGMATAAIPWPLRGMYGPGQLAEVEAAARRRTIENDANLDARREHQRRQVLGPGFERSAIVLEWVRVLPPVYVAPSATLRSSAPAPLPTPTGRRDPRKAAWDRDPRKAAWESWFKLREAKAQAFEEEQPEEVRTHVQALKVALDEGHIRPVTAVAGWLGSRL